MQLGHGDVGIEMGVLQDGHGRVGADVEELRDVGVLPLQPRVLVGLSRILEEEAIDLGSCSVVLILDILINGVVNDRILVILKSL